MKNMTDAELLAVFVNPKPALEGWVNLLKTAKAANVDAAELEKLEKTVAVMKATAASMPAMEKKVEKLGLAMIEETKGKIDAMDATKLTDLVAQVDCDAMLEKLGPGEQAACVSAKTGEAAARTALKGLWLKGVLRTRACLSKKVVADIGEGKNLYADEAATMGALKSCVADLANVFTTAEFPAALFTATAPTTAAVENAEKAIAKKIADAKKASGAAFVVASGASLAALALF